MCVCGREKDREKKREGNITKIFRRVPLPSSLSRRALASACVCVCVCVCVRERERERERERIQRFFDEFIALELVTNGIGKSEFASRG